MSQTSPDPRPAMCGLTVRWSLEGTPSELAALLGDYVAETSHARFTGRPGLGFKTWRMVPGAWFEGLYVFGSDGDRVVFQETFSATAADSPVSKLIGTPPLLIEACVVVSVAQGGAGFHAAPRWL